MVQWIKLMSSLTRSIGDYIPKVVEAVKSSKAGGTPRANSEQNTEGAADPKGEQVQQADAEAANILEESKRS